MREDGEFREARIENQRERRFAHTSVVHRVHLGRVVGHDDGWLFWVLVVDYREGVLKDGEVLFRGKVKPKGPQDECVLRVTSLAVYVVWSRARTARRGWL